jgi:hypothetical protein
MATRNGARPSLTSENASGLFAASPQTCAAAANCHVLVAAAARGLAKISF